MYIHIKFYRHKLVLTSMWVIQWQVNSDFSSHIKKAVLGLILLALSILYKLCTRLEEYCRFEISVQMDNKTSHGLLFCLEHKLSPKVHEKCDRSAHRYSTALLHRYFCFQWNENAYTHVVFLLKYEMLPTVNFYYEKLNSLKLKKEIP